MWGCELGRNALRGASEGLVQLFLPSVQAHLVGDLGQSFSTICRIISKEVGVSVFVLGFFPGKSFGDRSPRSKNSQHLQGRV